MLHRRYEVGERRVSVVAVYAPISSDSDHLFSPIQFLQDSFLALKSRVRRGTSRRFNPEQGSRCMGSDRRTRAHRMEHHPLRAPQPNESFHLAVNPLSLSRSTP